jgi:hypothetical protein
MLANDEITRQRPMTRPNDRAVAWRPSARSAPYPPTAAGSAASDTVADPVALAVIASDRVLGEGVASVLSRRGEVSVVSRREADYDRIVRAVCAARDGSLEMLGAVVGRLIGRLRAIEAEVLRPKLSSSERTIKNIIHGLLNRNNPRNRAHAVAFAHRGGLL